MVAVNVAKCEYGNLIFCNTKYKMILGQAYGCAAIAADRIGNTELASRYFRGRAHSNRN